MTYTDDSSYVPEQSTTYVAQDPTYVAPIAEGVERSWISRNWWLPLLAALALASLLIWLANRHQTCAIAGGNLTITTEQENTMISHLQEILPDQITEENRVAAMNASRNVCAARLSGETGETLTGSITREFTGFLPGFNLEGDALTQLGNFIAGETWCRC